MARSPTPSPQPDGAVLTAKALTTPGRLSDGVIEAINGLGIALEHVTAFVHGTTAGLNALLERRGGRVALVTTAGLHDVYEIGRASRPAMYDIRYRAALPLVRRRDVFELNERLDAAGEPLVPLDIAEVEQLRRASTAPTTPSPCACCTRTSTLPTSGTSSSRCGRSSSTPSSSRRTRSRPEWREFERTSSTVVSAYVAPLLDEYLTELESRLAEIGCACLSG